MNVVITCGNKRRLHIRHHPQGSHSFNQVGAEHLAVREQRAPVSLRIYRHQGIEMIRHTAALDQRLTGLQRREHELGRRVADGVHLHAVAGTIGVRQHACQCRFLVHKHALLVAFEARTGITTGTDTCTIGTATSAGLREDPQSSGLCAKGAIAEDLDSLHEQPRMHVRRIMKSHGALPIWSDDFHIYIGETSGAERRNSLDSSGVCGGVVQLVLQGGEKDAQGQRVLGLQRLVCSVPKNTYNYSVPNF